MSGGSVRGLSYIGFLKILEREKIPIDYVAGTSIGAMIGAFYCSGMRAEDMEALVTGINWKDFMDFTSGYTGLLDGKKIEGFLRKNLRINRFEKLYTPLVVTSVDINSGEEIIFDKGDVARAVRASISIPGVFTPVRIGKHLLVDGGVLDPIPISALKGKVDRIIAIDLSIPYEQYKYAKAVDGTSETWKSFKNLFVRQEVVNLKTYLKDKRAFPKIFLRLLNPKYFLRFLQGKPINMPPLFKVVMRANNLSSNELIHLKLEKYKPDLLIKPDIKDARFIEFDKFSYLIGKGEEAALKNIREIKRLAKMP